MDSVPRFYKGAVISKTINTDGYYHLKLSKNNISKTCRVHRLVAEAFIPNPNNLPEVNCIDCNRKNNKISNLEWCNHADNVRHSSKQGKYKRYGERNSNFGKHTLHEIYKNNSKLALEKLSRPKSQNGRAVSVNLFDREHNFIKKFDWIGGCAEYLRNNNVTSNKIDSIRSNIRLAMNNGTKYLNHYFEKA